MAHKSNPYKKVGGRIDLLHQGLQAAHVAFVKLAVASSGCHPKCSVSLLTYPETQTWTLAANNSESQRVCPYTCKGKTASKPGSLEVPLEVEEEANAPPAKEAPQDAPALQVSRGCFAFPSCGKWLALCLCTVLVHVPRFGNRKLLEGRGLTSGSQDARPQATEA